jgi:hypothetical protein
MFGAGLAPLSESVEVPRRRSADVPCLALFMNVGSCTCRLALKLVPAAGRPTFALLRLNDPSPRVAASVMFTRPPGQTFTPSCTPTVSNNAPSANSPDLGYDVTLNPVPGGFCRCAGDGILGIHRRV